MPKRTASDLLSDGGAIERGSIPIETTEPINNWDTETERDKQELAKYEKIECTIINQLVKETNAILAMLRSKTGRLCQLDRQYLRAKLRLMEAKLEASVMAEQQTLKIKSAARRRKGAQT